METMEMAFRLLLLVCIFAALHLGQEQENTSQAPVDEQEVMCFLALAAALYIQGFPAPIIIDTSSFIFGAALQTLTTQIVWGPYSSSTSTHDRNVAVMESHFPPLELFILVFTLKWLRRSSFIVESRHAFQSTHSRTADFPDLGRALHSLFEGYPPCKGARTKRKKLKKPEFVPGEFISSFPQAVNSSYVTRTPTQVTSMADVGIQSTCVKNLNSTTAPPLERHGEDSFCFEESVTPPRSSRSTSHRFPHSLDLLCLEDLPSYHIQRTPEDSHTAPPISALDGSFFGHVILTPPTPALRPEIDYTIKTPPTPSDGMMEREEELLHETSFPNQLESSAESEQAGDLSPIAPANNRDSDTELNTSSISTVEEGLLSLEELTNIFAEDDASITSQEEGSQLLSELSHEDSVGDVFDRIQANLNELFDMLAGESDTQAQETEGFSRGYAPVHPASTVFESSKGASYPQQQQFSFAGNGLFEGSFVLNRSIDISPSDSERREEHTSSESFLDSGDTKVSSLKQFPLNASESDEGESPSPPMEQAFHLNRSADISSSDDESPKENTDSESFLDSGNTKVSSLEHTSKSVAGKPKTWLPSVEQKRSHEKAFSHFNRRVNASSPTDFLPFDDECDSGSDQDLVHNDDKVKTSHEKQYEEELPLPLDNSEELENFSMGSMDLFDLDEEAFPLDTAIGGENMHEDMREECVYFEIEGYFFHFEDFEQLARSAWTVLGSSRNTPLLVENDNEAEYEHLSILASDVVAFIVGALENREVSNGMQVVDVDQAVRISSPGVPAAALMDMAQEVEENKDPKANAVLLSLQAPTRDDQEDEEDEEASSIAEQEITSSFNAPDNIEMCNDVKDEDDMGSANENASIQLAECAALLSLNASRATPEEEEEEEEEEDESMELTECAALLSLNASRATPEEEEEEEEEDESMELTACAALLSLQASSSTDQEQCEEEEEEEDENMELTACAALLSLQASSSADQEHCEEEEKEDVSIAVQQIMTSLIETLESIGDEPKEEKSCEHQSDNQVDQLAARLALLDLGEARSIEHFPRLTEGSSFPKDDEVLSCLSQQPTGYQHQAQCEEQGTSAEGSSAASTAPQQKHKRRSQIRRVKNPLDQVATGLEAAPVKSDPSVSRNASTSQMKENSMFQANARKETLGQGSSFESVRRLDLITRVEQALQPLSNNIITYDSDQ